MHEVKRSRRELLDTFQRDVRDALTELKDSKGNVADCERSVRDLVDKAKESAKGLTSQADRNYLETTLAFVLFEARQRGIEVYPPELPPPSQYSESAEVDPDTAIQGVSGHIEKFCKEAQKSCLETATNGVFRSEADVSGPVFERIADLLERAGVASFQRARTETVTWNGRQCELRREEHVVIHPGKTVTRELVAELLRKEKFTLSELAELIRGSAGKD